MNMSIVCHSRALRVGTAEFGPIGSAFEGHGSPTSFNTITYVCKPTEFKDDICTDCFQNAHANFPLYMQIISQIQIKRFGVGVEAV